MIPLTLSSPRLNTTGVLPSYNLALRSLELTIIAKLQFFLSIASKYTEPSLDSTSSKCAADQINTSSTCQNIGSRPNANVLVNKIFYRNTCKCQHLASNAIREEKSFIVYANVKVRQEEEPTRPAAEIFAFHD
jgi:hypothetical protein